jgi:hypothetical protein
MSDPFALWTGYIVLAGLFLVFLAHFGKFVHGEVWPVLAPLVRWLRHLW